MSDHPTFSKVSVEQITSLFLNAFPNYETPPPTRYFKTEQGMVSLRLQEIAFYRHYEFTIGQGATHNMCADAFFNAINHIKRVQEFLIMYNDDDFHSVPDAWLIWLKFYKEYSDARVFAMIILCRRILKRKTQQMEALYAYLESDPITLEVMDRLVRSKPRERTSSILSIFNFDLHNIQSVFPKTYDTAISNKVIPFFEVDSVSTNRKGYPTDMGDPDRGLQILLNEHCFDSLRDGSRMVGCVTFIVDICCVVIRKMMMRTKAAQDRDRWIIHVLNDIKELCWVLSRVKTLGRYAYEYYMNTTLEIEIRTKPPTSGEAFDMYKCGPSQMLLLGAFFEDDYIGKLLGRFMYDSQSRPQKAETPLSQPSTPASKNPGNARRRGHRRS